MKKIRILALISAIIVAVLLYNYLNTISEPTVVEVSKTEVIVASVDIAPNVPITNEMLKPIKMSEEAVHSLSVKDIDEIVGKVSTSEIIAGEQILSLKLITPGEGNGTLAYKINTGMRAITIAVNNITGLSNMIMPDNRVDIIGQYEIEVEDPARMANDDPKTISYTTMLLENVKVLSVDDNMTKQDKEESEESYVSLTLEVTPLQAMEVSMTEFKGALRAILRSPLDEGTTSLPALTIEKVVFKNK